jgi:branched-subunit amino acid transport protein
MNMQHNYWIYLLIMFGVTYLTRVAPLIIFRNKIENQFIRSFLYYVPYAVLASMTFPAMFFAADYLPAAACGVIAALVAAFMGRGLFTVAVTASAAVYLVSLFCSIFV